MPNALSEQLNELAKGFARDLAAALRAASIDEVTSLALANKAMSALPAVVAKSAKERVTKERATNGRAVKERSVEAPVKRGRGRPRTGSQAAGDAASRIPQIVAYVASHPGVNAEKARAALVIPKGEWSAFVARAVKAGKLRTEGQRRGMKYWAT